METCQRNISLYLNLKQNIWLCRIKLTADTFSTQFCVTKCNGGTMKSLEIKIASFCELFQNRFYFKDLWHELSSWSVRKFWKFLFHCIINMKNNYHQTFIVVYSMKSLMNYKRQVNTYLALNITRCWYYLNESVILNVEVKTLIIIYMNRFFW